MTELKYFIYCRKSSEEETKQIQSLDTQQRLLLDLAKNQKLHIVGIIKESKSAKTDQNRSLFTHMLERIENGEANAIMVVHADRLSRNMIEGGLLVKLYESGYLKEIKTLSTTYDTQQSMLHLGFDIVFSSHYSRDLSVKVKAGNESKLLKGEYPTYAPIGYINIQPGRGIKPDPIRAKHITNAFNYFATGEYSVKTL
ncbi:MAG TPA: recombinase family protein, partial [Candidatus Woesebacteria bacterium]|nr:recombinase family protein [Candidatus Woesebacteria bacterium]